MSTRRGRARRPASLGIGAIAAGVLALAVPAASAQAFQAFDPGASSAEPLDVPGISEYAPAAREGKAAPELKQVRLEARLAPDQAPLEHGLTWRVFHSIPGPDGKLPLLATSQGGVARFEFEPGEYFVHVAFGKAGVTKKLTVPKVGPVEKQSLILNAGGLILQAVSGDGVKIPPKALKFSIYTGDTGEDGERGLVLADVKPGTLVALNAGTYHVVSDYGDVNAVVRADIRIQAGKLTEATIQHRAAQLTLKLVAAPGGEAIADTAWSILTTSGDVVSESVGAFPSLVLAEGEYTAVAKNKGHIYQQDFKVAAGQNRDVEVLLRDDVSATDTDPSASGPAAAGGADQD